MIRWWAEILSVSGPALARVSTLLLSVYGAVVMQLVLSSPFALAETPNSKKSAEKAIPAEASRPDFQPVSIPDGRRYSELTKSNWEQNPSRREFHGGWYKGGHPKECQFLRKLLGAGRFRQLLQQANFFLSKDPKSLDYLYMKAQALSKLNDKRASIQVCNTILAADPKNGSTLILREYLYACFCEYEKAVGDSSLMIAVAPKDDRGYWLRSAIYLKCCEPEKAMPDCNKAVEYGPGWFHYFNRAVAYIQLGDWNRAIADYVEARKLNKTNHMLLLMRGIGYRNTGQYQNAINDFTSAMELSPNFWKLYQLRGSTFLLMGQKEKARKDFEQAALNEPDYARDFFRFESSSNSLANEKKATRAQDDVDDEVEKGTALFKTGNYAEALKLFNNVLASRPANVDARMMRSQVFRKLKQFDRAVRDLDLIPSWESQSGELNAQLKALIYFEQGSKSQTLAATNSAIYFDPTWSEAYYLKAASLDGLGRKGEALTNYKKFVDLVGKGQKKQSGAALVFPDKAKLNAALEQARKRISEK